MRQGGLEVRYLVVAQPDFGLVIFDEAPDEPDLDFLVERDPPSGRRQVVDGVERGEALGFQSMKSS